MDAPPSPNLVPPVALIIPPPGMRHVDYLRLAFPPSHQEALDGDYQTHGAICFPVADMRKDGAIDRVRGYWLIAGRERRTGEIRVFESGEFLVVGDLISDFGAVQAMGSWRVFTRIFGQYGTSAWWFIGDEETTRPYRMDLYRHEGVRPKPAFVQLISASPVEGAARVFAMGEAGMIRVPAGGDLAKAIRAAQPDTPEMLALSALAIGFSEKRK